MVYPRLINEPVPLQFWRWVTDPLGYMDRAVKDNPDLFTAQLWRFGSTLIFVHHPEGVQQILTSDRKVFSAPGSVNRIIEPLMGSGSLIMLEGERHRKERQLIMPSFHGERVRLYGQLICDATHQVLAKLSPQQPFTARNISQRVSLRVILTAVFGLHQGERYTEISQRVARMGNTFNAPLASLLLFFPALQKDLGPWSPWGKFCRNRDRVDQLLYQEIAERRAAPDPERTDILSLLMKARDSEGKALGDEDLRDQLMTLLFAGHGTTATAIAWALYWIHRLPQVKDKLLQELAQVGDDPVQTARLPYLGAVCNETLRIYPVGLLTFPRVAQEPVNLLGYPLEPGAIAAPCIYLLHRRPELYPDPESFRPERFLERQFGPYEYLPFGGGARRCIGEALAMFEMKLVIATILTHYELDLASSDPERVQRRGLTLAPAKGVEMIFKRQRERVLAPQT